MTYEYHCKKCDQYCDIIKGADDFDRSEHCTICGQPMTRVFKPIIHLTNTQVHNPYYSIALGDMVKSPKDERRKAKERGMEEVGNENVRKHVKRRRQSYDI